MLSPFESHMQHTLQWLCAKTYSIWHLLIAELFRKAFFSEMTWHFSDDKRCVGVCNGSPECCVLWRDKTKNIRSTPWFFWFIYFSLCHLQTCSCGACLSASKLILNSIFFTSDYICSLSFWSQCLAYFLKCLTPSQCVFMCVSPFWISGTTNRFLNVLSA